MSELVDPRDQQRVQVLLDRVQASLGIGGISDLLLRLPGTRFTPPTAKRFLAAATPGVVWLGAQDQLLLTDPPTHVQIVGGVVLHRDELLPGELAGVVAGLIARLVADFNGYDEAVAALSAAAEVVDRF
jgi:hypothetical protein